MFISVKESRIENNKSFYGCFYLGSFDAGQSITVANALRRSLLSDCTGLAIISVKIENVQHEYSTLPGVRDSILDILLNFKEIVLKKIKNPFGGPNGYKNKSFSSLYDKVGSTFFKPVIGYLKVRGPGIIRAKDLRLPPFIQCVDPNQYIATLADDGYLNAKFVIMEGKSYYIGPVRAPSMKSNNLGTRQDNKKTNFPNDVGQNISKYSPSTTSLENPSNYWTIIKKRENLLKQLKSIMGKDEKTFGFNQTKQLSNTSVPSDLIQSSQKTNFSEKKHGIPPKGEPVRGAVGPASERFLNTYNENSKQLNIDAVFNPVTKVNYIIEGYDNYMIQSYNEKYKLVENLTTFLDSAKFLETNFPYFSKKWKSDGFKPEDENQDTTNSRLHDQVSQSGTASFFEKDKTKDSQQNSISKNLLDYVTNLSTSDLSILCTPEGYSHYKGIGIPSSFSESILPSTLDSESLEGTFEWGLNVSSKQVVLLEIWTNGSLHPRDALLDAFKNLSHIFSPGKIKMTNPLFSNSLSYKNIMENL